MKGKQKFFVVLFVMCLIGLVNQSAAAQSKGEYSGTVVSFNGPRLESAPFTLRVSGLTSDEKAKDFLSILKDKGQDDLLQAIGKEDLGSLSVNNRIGPTINVARESTVDGKLRVFAVFARWTRFAELRGGYRSADYPFGVIELFIDEKTGKGEGTYIAAAKISWDDNRVEIESFGTYPAKLMGVKQSKAKL